MALQTNGEAVHVAVLGSGGVGAYFGGRLALAGRDVSFVARGEHLAAMRERGLRVDSTSGDFVLARVKATDRTAEIGPVDVVLVCVKSWQVAGAAESIAPLMGPRTVVVTTQNGVEAADQLVERLGPGVVAAGTARIVSFVVGPGHVRHAGYDPHLFVGALDDACGSRLAPLMPALRVPGFGCDRVDDIRAQQWIKFVFVCGWGAVAALTRKPVGALREAPDTRRMIEDAMREIETVALARGVELADAVSRGMAVLDSLPPDSTVSLQRDLSAGVPSELEAFSGAVVRFGEATGVATPIHRLAYETMLPLETRARRATPSTAS